MCLAVPGKIASISGDEPLSRTGKVDFGGILKDVSLAYVPEANVGDYVIVHVGFALSRVDEAEAQQVFAYLREMQELSDLETADADPPPAATAESARSSPR
jgi:hydrogenase expression/formation protein HypC